MIIADKTTTLNYIPPLCRNITQYYGEIRTGRVHVKCELDFILALQALRLLSSEVLPTQQMKFLRDTL